MEIAGAEDAGFRAGSHVGAVERTDRAGQVDHAIADGHVIGAPKEVDPVESAGRGRIPGRSQVIDREILNVCQAQYVPVGGTRHSRDGLSVALDGHHGVRAAAGYAVEHDLFLIGARTKGHRGGHMPGNAVGVEGCRKVGERLEIAAGGRHAGIDRIGAVERLSGKAGGNRQEKSKGQEKG